MLEKKGEGSRFRLDVVARVWEHANTNCCMPWEPFTNKVDQIEIAILVFFGITL